MSKFAQGRLDLHSGRSQVDLDWYADQIQEARGPDELADAARSANTALEVLEKARQADFDIAGIVARHALETAHKTLRGSGVAPDIVIVDRKGKVVARAE